MTHVVIIDYGSGNIGSVANMIRRVGHHPVVSQDPDVISTASHLVLVGVGAFDSGMSRLSSLDLIEPIRDAVRERGSHLLGVCLGMQLLTEGSDEGELDGLGFVHGRCRRLTPTTHYRVPNMGWREIYLEQEHPVFAGLEGASRFYFVHSYAPVCEDQSNVLATLAVDRTINAAIVSDNVIGVQFHPEKSHRFGMRLYANFCDL